MKVNPIFYKYPELYGKIYVGGYNASLRLGRAAELIAAVIPEYTHQDVYSFLTEPEFRHSILGAKQNYIENSNTRRVWVYQHEHELNKRRWYKDSLEIIKHLINCEDPSPIYSSTREGAVYHAIESSHQLLIPVHRYWTGDHGESLIKNELLILLSALGIEFFEPGWSRELNLGLDTGFWDIPNIHVHLPALSFFDDQHPFVGSIEIYLPANELETLKSRLLLMSETELNV